MTIWYAIKYIIWYVSWCIIWLLASLACFVAPVFIFSKGRSIDGNIVEKGVFVISIVGLGAFMGYTLIAPALLCIAQLFPKKGDRIQKTVNKLWPWW